MPDWLPQTYKWLDNQNNDPAVEQAFALGFQGKQRALDRELHVRELDMRAQQQDLLAQLRREKLNADLVAQEGVAALAGVMGEAARAGFDEASEAKLWETAGKYPALMTRPEFKEFTQQFELSRAAKARKDYLATQITGREDLEDLKFEHRQALLGDKYARLAELQEDSQEAQLLRDQIKHGYDLERDQLKPRAQTGVTRFNLPWTDQRAMDSELKIIEKDLFAKPEDKTKRSEAVYRKYKAIADGYAKPKAQGTNAPGPAISFEDFQNWRKNVK